MSERIADPQVVCPFVAFDDDRDFRAPVPDHRHRCFAESPAAPRALAHQAAYCLAGAFPGCPTFVDWARREAAPPKVESPVRSLRGPAGTPRAAAGAPVPSTGPAVDAAPRSSADNWTAPPPWAASAAAAGAGAAAGTVGDRAPDDDLERADPREGAASPMASGDERYGQPANPLDDTPAFLAGRSARPAPPPAARQDEEPAVAAGDTPPDDRYALPDDRYAPPDDRYGQPEAPRPPAEPRRVPVGYAAVAPSRNDRRAGGSRKERSDSEAPSWEQPRRFEAYPTLKSRGGGGIPRIALYAIVVLLVGIGLFMAPFLLKGLGGGGEQASPTTSASGSALPTSVPGPTAVPTPEQVVYTIKAGDSLSKIAAKYDVTVEQIMEANPKIKNPNRIAVGDKIIIPQALPSQIVDGEITPAP